MASQTHYEGGLAPSEGDTPPTRLDQVAEPGTYVCPQTGDLIRLVRGGAPLDDTDLRKKLGEEPVYVTRISNDPFIPISRARVAAANLDVDISF